MLDIRTVDLARLNSATKYPEIPTYHMLKDKVLHDGTLTVDFGDADVYVTEKIDGTNGRITLLPNGSWLIGSREEWLTARGDLIANNVENIVEVLRPIAERMAAGASVVLGRHSAEAVVTGFFEVYGGVINGAGRQYTGNKSYGARLFDIAILDGDDMDVLNWERDKIAGWRKHGGQFYVYADALPRWADALMVETVPSVSVSSGLALPTTLEDTEQWLTRVAPVSQAGLDDGGKGKCEGVVVRSVGRDKITKIRLEDYERTRRINDAKARKKGADA